jgi:hypothetical protein
MRELSLHILDIAENAAAAGATRIAVAVDESTAADRLSFTVEDDGAGLCSRPRPGGATARWRSTGPRRGAARA